MLYPGHLYCQFLKTLLQSDLHHSYILQSAQLRVKSFAQEPNMVRLELRITCPISQPLGYVRVAVGENT